MTNQLDYAFQISTKSYQQEIERGQVIVSRADYLMKWVTLFISVFNIAIPILIKEINFDYRSCEFILLYSILMGSLIIAMVSLVLVNIPKKIKHYPFGYEILKKDGNLIEKKDLDLEIVYSCILTQDAITKSIKHNNDKAIIEILIADIAIIVSVFSLALSFVYIMLNT